MKKHIDVEKYYDDQIKNIHYDNGEGLSLKTFIKIVIISILLAIGIGSCKYYNDGPEKNISPEEYERRRPQLKSICDSESLDETDRIVEENIRLQKEFHEKYY